MGKLNCAAGNAIMGAAIIDDILEGRQPEGFVSAIGTQLKMEGID